MIPLNLILSNMDIMAKLPQLVVIVCAVILMLAFFVGFAKGFKQVSWCWLPCLAGFVGFMFAMKLLKEKNLAFKGLSIPGMSEMAMTTLVVAFGCLLVAMVLYGFFSAVFRPRSVWVKKDKKQFRKEQKSGTGDGNPKKLVWKNLAPPTFYGRFWGAVLCVVNTAVALAIVLSCGLLLINAVDSLKVKFADVMNVKIMHLALQYANKYALDFLTLCIPFFIACYGYKCGLAGSLRTIVMKAGGALVIVLAFGLPFMSEAIPAKINVVGKLINRCAALLGKVPDFVKPLAAKLLAGVVLLLILGILLALTNYFIDRYYKMLKNAKLIRVIDSSVSCLIYFGIGVMASIGLWAALYAVEAFGFVNISSMVGEDTMLAKELLGFVKTFMDPKLARFIAG